MARLNVFLASLLVACAADSIARAQNAEPASAPTAAAATPEDDNSVLKQAAAHMGAMRMRRIDKSEVVELVDRSLLTYGDAARANQNGSLWAFGKTGRPLAMVELYQGTEEVPRWVHAITLTGTGRVSLKTPIATTWQPESTQIEPAALARGGPPHEKEAMRLRQMKVLARRFTAHEFWDPDNSRFELRLLVQPVHRYSDPAAGIQDGTVFVLAHGTNPEVLLLIEAVGKTVETSSWHYSLARLGSAELHVELDDAEVWKRDRTPGIVGKPTDPYWLFWCPVELAAVEPKE